MVADPWELIVGLLASVCHQLPERSFGREPFVAPLCYRCSAFYTAYAGSLSFVVCSRISPRALASLVLGSLLVAVMGVDVYLVGSTNFSRVATGLLAGSGAGLVAGGLLLRRFQRADPPSPTAAWWLAWAALVTTASLGPLGIERPELSATLSVIGAFVVVSTAPVIIIGTRSKGRASAGGH